MPNETRHVEEFKRISKAHPSVFHRLGRFILTLDELDANQTKCMEIFGQCVILEARSLHPAFFMPIDAEQKIIYTARSHHFSEVKHTRSIPWYLWTLEEDLSEEADLSGMLWQPSRITAPELNTR